MPFGKGLAAALASANGLVKPAAPAAPSPQPAAALSPTHQSAGRKVVKLPVMQNDPPRISIVSMLERYLHRRSDDKAVIDVHIGGHRSQGVFHPSEICKEQVCKRALAYEIYSAPPDPKNIDPRMQRIFDTGHFVHARVQHYLKEAFKEEGGVFHDEVRIPPNEKRISGTTDGAGLLNGWCWLLEIKSMNNDKFKTLGAKPWPEHEVQLQIYMGLLGQKAGIVLVENKNNSDFREYFVRFDPQKWADINAMADEVLAYVAALELPPQVSKADGCTGDWCKFFRTCKHGANPDWKPTPPAPLKRKE